MTAALMAAMSPDDQAWVGQVERQATALKIAIDSNRKIVSAARRWVRCDSRWRAHANKAGEPGALPEGVATIANDAQGSLLSEGRRGDYDVVLSKRGAAVSQSWRKGRVTGFDRKNRGGWDLLFLALRACVADRNP